MEKTTRSNRMNFRRRRTYFSVSWGIRLTGASTVWKFGLVLNYPVWGNPDSTFRKIVLVESGILGFGMRNIAQGIQNSTNDWNSGVPESKFHWEKRESSSWNREFTVWNPESGTVLDSLTWADLNVTFYLFKEQLGFKKLSGKFTTMEKSTANELKTVFHS